MDNLDNDGKKIFSSGSIESMDQKNKMFKIDKNSKRQKQSINDLPESVRILGVHFDPEMFFHDHIRIVRKKVEEKIHCLLKFQIIMMIHSALNMIHC